MKNVLSNIGNWIFLQIARLMVFAGDTVYRRKFRDIGWEHNNFKDVEKAKDFDPNHGSCV